MVIYRRCVKFIQLRSDRGHADDVTAWRQKLSKCQHLVRQFWKLTQSGMSPFYHESWIFRLDGLLKGAAGVTVKMAERVISEKQFAKFNIIMFLLGKLAILNK